MLKHALVILALVATPLDGEAASRNIQRSAGSVEADSLSSVTLFVEGESAVHVKFIGRRGLVPMVEVVNEAGDVQPMGSVRYSRSGHVLKFSMRAPGASERLTFRVTGRNHTAGNFKMLVQQRRESPRRR